MGDDEPSHEGEFEISPVNPRAHRVRGGVWNEDELPVLPWEMAEYRQVLPPSVQRWIGTGVPVVRVSIDIVRKQYGKHADVRSWFEEFDLDSWEFARVVIGDRGRKWEFVQLVEDAPG